MKPTLKIDIYTRPAMSEARSMLAKNKANFAAKQVYYKELEKDTKNKLCSTLEHEFVALGLVSTIEDAFELHHKLNPTKDALIFLNNEAEETKTIPLVEYPTLKKIMDEYLTFMENTRKEAEEFSETHNADNKKAWNMISHDLVTLGKFATFEEADKHDYQLQGGRFLMFHETKQNPLLKAINELNEVLQ